MAIQFMKKEYHGFHIRSFDTLTAHELYEIFRARADVFVGEERILYPDADGIDYDCLHVFCVDADGKVMAYLRMFPKYDEPGVVQMGRVLTRVHGGGMGKKLLEAGCAAARDDMGAGEIYIESQKHAEGFYHRLGFRTVSDDFMEAGIPHVQMRKKLDVLTFVPLNGEDSQAVREMSVMATEIVREHFDPLIGREQNDYMIARFQTADAIRQQLADGYRYFFAEKEEKPIGFLAFYPRNDIMYLSKFYLYKNQRGRGYSREMLQFVIDRTREEGLRGIELNVNRHNDACRAYDRLGFTVIRSEKNDIGHGFYMDDFVYHLDV